MSSTTDQKPAVGDAIAQRELRLSASRGTRWAFIGLGTASLIVGTIGIFVPGLPTTIFLICAAGAYARGSERLHRWLLTNRWLGHHVRDWYNHRSLPKRTKLIIVACITISSAICGVLIASHLPLQLAVLAVALVGVWYVGVHIPTRRNTNL
jgi:uncharacterized membrane protein YbaN (DUF454 family)